MRSQKRSKGMERVTRQKEEEEGIRDTSRQMLRWSKVADSNSRVQDRNHSTKHKSRVVCNREGKKTERDSDAWQVKSRGRGGSKMRKVEVASQKGWVKIRLDRNWGEQRKTWRARKVRHLQASSDNSFNTPGARCMRGAGIVNTLCVRCLQLSEFIAQIKCVLLPFLSPHLNTCACRLHCEYWAGYDNIICCCD